MRACLVAPLVSVVDDRDAQLGGAQAFVADLACGLAAAGHDVSLIAARGSHVRGVRMVDLDIDASRLVAATLHTAAERRDDAAQRDAFARVRGWIDGHSGDVDVVHAHSYDGPAFDALEGARVPVVHTLHLPPNDPTVVRAARASQAARVTVSRANAAAWEAAGVSVRAVIPNGVDVARIPLGAGDGGYLLCAGRIAPEKGVDAAARIARAAGLPLWVVGDVYDDDAKRAIDPEGVRFREAVPRAELFRIMGNAVALLMPVTWEEPFGLVAIEAMAAGTPVLAYPRGGLPEVIADGRTGFLATDEDALARAVPLVRRLDRRACREHVVANFALERMVAEYARLYASL